MVGRDSFMRLPPDIFCRNPPPLLYTSIHFFNWLALRNPYFALISANDADPSKYSFTALILVPLSYTLFCLCGRKAAFPCALYCAIQSCILPSEVPYCRAIPHMLFSPSKQALTILTFCSGVYFAFLPIMIMLPSCDSFSFTVFHEGSISFPGDRFFCGNYFLYFGRAT